MIKKTAIILFLLFLPVVALAQGNCDPNSTTVNLCNPLGSGIETPAALMSQILVAIGSIVGTLALMMIMYSGFRMLIAQGNPESIKTAKSGLTWSVVGFAVSILAFVIVVVIQNFIGFTGEVGSEAEAVNPLSSDNLQEFIPNILENFLGFLGILAIMMIIFSGFRYVTSAGNEEQTKNAKSSLLWSVLGFVTIILSYALLQVVKNLLNV